MKLYELNINQKAIIDYIDTSDFSAKRLIEIGFSKGSEVKKVISSISKSLNAYKVKNTVVVLRNSTAENIKVSII